MSGGVRHFLLFCRHLTGVRQGGVLSPTLVTCHYACSKLWYIICFSIFLYADDIMLLSPSVGNLQLLLTYLEMSLNTQKNVASELLVIDLTNYFVV